MVKKVFNIVIAILFVVWCYLLITDYFRVKNDEKAKYCIEHAIYDYTDGSVEECVGLGYKVYYYNRPNINVKAEFGPFWIKMKD